MITKKDTESQLDAKHARCCAFIFWLLLRCALSAEQMKTVCVRDVFGGATWSLPPAVSENETNPQFCQKQ